MSKNNDPLNTPVMQQYLDLKKKYSDCILLFRMGDFYEIFLEDAKKAAPVMDIALTQRQKQVPMAGIPYHSIENYLSRLLEAGFHVAIAEQEIDPKNPNLMSRRVRRVMTPATLLEENLLDKVNHNYLMAIVYDHKFFGIACADISTGDFLSFEVELKKNTLEEKLYIFHDQNIKFNPREILLPLDLYNELSKSSEKSKMHVMESWKASPAEGKRQIEKIYKSKLEGLGYIQKWDISLGAVSMILHYIQQNFPEQEVKIQAPTFRSLVNQYMHLDEQSIQNLDIITNQREGGKNRTLYSVLDECLSNSGKRCLKQNLLFPLLDLKAIQKRQAIVAYFFEKESLRENLRLGLKNISDLERILSRMQIGRTSPRDFIAIQQSIQQASELFHLLEQHSELDPSLLFIPYELLEIAKKIEKEICSDPPAILPGTKAFIKIGIDSSLDKAREANQKGNHWILNYEKEERNKSNIPNLRIKYNRVQGYFIEISKGQANKAPKEYYKKQTLISCERFSTQKLSELESQIKEAEQIIQDVEIKKFEEFTILCLDSIEKIKKLMQEIAYLDFYLSLAFVAFQKKWILPEVLEKPILEIEEASHPVVEHYLELGESFTPNNLFLGVKKRSLAIITGPNMAGKSTYIRQVALLQLLAQIGSFVPAKTARLGLSDRIFTRIGAGDNLSRGESTFFVEMLEASRILNQSTSRSLVIMDEVGRGTSTYDGLALAWAIVEYLADEKSGQPRTLFASHYHELTELEKLSSVFNLSMQVREENGEILFLHRVKEGVADRSYGIHVAQLAGLPKSVIQRAQSKLEELEKTSLAKTNTYVKPKEQKHHDQDTLFHFNE